MSDREFEIGARKFKLNKIDAFKQFHIVRRLAPILSDLLPSLGEFKKIATAGESISEIEKLEGFAKLAAPLMNGLSKLSDEDSDRVLFGLLSSVELKQEPVGNWAKVAREDMLMMQDMDLPILLQIAGRALVFNLASFFAALPRK